MKILKIVIPSAIAILMAVLISLYLVEDILLILLSFAILPITLTVAFVQSMRTKQSRLRTYLLTFIPVILFLLSFWSHIPLRLVFQMYNTEFDQIAVQIQVGTSPSTPFWIGPFKIKMAGQRGDSGTPYLATNTDESEINGFVRHPNGHGFNLWSCIRLNDSWSYITED